MIDLQHFEGLCEALGNEVEELPEGSAKENLLDISSVLYGIYEELTVLDFDSDKLQEENTVMRQLLADLLSDEDKRYYQIKHGIDLGV